MYFKICSRSGSSSSAHHRRSIYRSHVIISTAQLRIVFDRYQIVSLHIDVFRVLVWTIFFYAVGMLRSDVICALNSL